MRSKKRQTRLGPVPTIRLTDSLPGVVNRRPRKNRAWNVVTAPFRALGAFWNWFMEGKPAASHRLRREPPGFK